MKKPEKQIIQHYNYRECEEYIAHKLGVKSLRDFAGKYSKDNNKDAPYQDFWHCIVDNNEVHNGCYIWICSDFIWPEWAIPIVEAFEEEFGLEKYWVDW